LLVLLALGAIGYGIYWWMKKRQTKKIEEEIYKTPIEKATSLLNVLEKNSFGKKEKSRNIIRN
jgi:Flp pilus assembly protein TadB